MFGGDIWINFYRNRYVIHYIDQYYDGSKYLIAQKKTTNILIFNQISISLSGEIEFCLLSYSKKTCYWPHIIESLLFPTNAKTLIYPKMNMTFYSRCYHSVQMYTLRIWAAKKRKKKADCFIIEN